MTPEGRWGHCVSRLREALAGPLPGSVAQLRVAARARTKRALCTPHGSKLAAVLILLYPHSGALHLPLTRRTDTVAAHKGQISLPGGAREEEESLIRTALREAQEELGVDPAAIEVLGQLTPLLTGSSGYHVTPVVGWTPARPVFRPDPREVAEVLQVPLPRLRAPEALREELWPRRGREAIVPCYRLGPEVAIWGATAMILSEFLEVLEGVGIE